MRRSGLACLVIAIAFTLSPAHATPAAYFVQGTMQESGSPAVYQATGNFCLPKCAAKSKPPSFALTGTITIPGHGPCQGLGNAGLSIAWPDGTTSWAYLDFIPEYSRTIVGTGVVDTGARLHAKVALTITSVQNPCPGPVAISGLIVFSK